MVLLENNIADKWYFKGKEMSKEKILTDFLFKYM